MIQMHEPWCSDQLKATFYRSLVIVVVEDVFIRPSLPLKISLAVPSLIRMIGRYLSAKLLQRMLSGSMLMWNRFILSTAQHLICNVRYQITLESWSYHGSNQRCSLSSFAFMSLFEGVNWLWTDIRMFMLKSFLVHVAAFCLLKKSLSE